MSVWRCQNVNSALPGEDEVEQEGTLGGLTDLYLNASSIYAFLWGSHLALAF